MVIRTQILHGDCREMLKTLPDESVHTCVTSPPYFGLRDYGVDGQIGLEQTPQAFVDKLVSVFREVRRVLRDDGTLWLNLGDSYSAGGRGGGAANSKQRTNTGAVTGDVLKPFRVEGVAPKQLLGIPWRVAFALQADGWYLRQDIIWSKPNPMPESVTDRCTKAHEYIFLLSKSSSYYFDSEAIKEPTVEPRGPGNKRAVRSLPGERETSGNANIRGSLHKIGPRETRNKRSVWTVSTKPFKGAHFATFPQDLIEPCIRAGAPINGVVLDPFNGAGTTGVVSLLNGRKYIGCELNPEYIALSQQRLAKAQEEVLW